MNANRILSLISCLLIIGVFSCEEEDFRLDPLVTPTDLVVDAQVAEDGSGLVEFSATANNALTYHFYFGLGASELPTAVASGKISKAYRTSGDYQVRVIAYGTGGVSTNTVVDVSVDVTFDPPANLVQTLTNGGSRTWLWRKEVPAHLGVGPEFFDDGNIGDSPIWYQASPFEKEAEGCLYDDRLTFTLESDGSITFTNENADVTYFHVDEASDALSVDRPPFDQCYEFNTAGVAPVGFFESESGIAGSTNISFELGNSAFMSYFLNESTYEILAYSDEELYIRTVQDVDGFKLAWYHKFTPEDNQSNETEIEYELVWSDEFDTDGAPNPDNWGYDLGTGCPDLCGWGNDEAQYYTDRPQNVEVKDGNLVITARRESFGGANFTSGRLTSKDKFEFQYGRVEVNAKLPRGGGTWPAIWMLGADIDTNPWPAAGEIDIMEHTGNNQDVVQAALHTPSSFGNTVNKGSKTEPGVSDEFHVYAVEWTADIITFFVDDQPYYSYSPEVKDNSTFPFNKDFYLLLNVAVGGTFGGAIAGNFTLSTMEIDYVRVYQEK